MHYPATDQGGQCGQAADYSWYCAVPGTRLLRKERALRIAQTARILTNSATQTARILTNSATQRARILANSATQRARILANSATQRARILTDSAPQRARILANSASKEREFSRIRLRATSERALRAGPIPLHSLDRCRKVIEQVAGGQSGLSQCLGSKITGQSMNVDAQNRRLKQRNSLRRKTS